MFSLKNREHVIGKVGISCVTDCGTKCIQYFYRVQYYIFGFTFHIFFTSDTLDGKYAPPNAFPVVLRM